MLDRPLAGIGDGLGVGVAHDLIPAGAAALGGAAEEGG